MKVKGQQKLLGSGGFKRVFEGRLKLNAIENHKERTTVPVAVLQYGAGKTELESRKGGILREIFLCSRLNHPSLLTMNGAYWPSESENGIPPRILTHLMTHNLRSARYE